jgi:hypothetical protein
MAEKKNWIDNTVDGVIDLFPYDYASWKSMDWELVDAFIRKKLLESYKNGAQAERRKASKKPEASANA